MPRLRLAPAVLLLLAASAFAESGRLYEPVFRRAAADDVLVKGEVSLTRGRVDAFIDLFEAAFDLGFTQQQEQDLRDGIETGFDAAEPDVRRSWLDLVKPLPGLKARAAEGQREAVKQGLREFRRQLDERISENPEHEVHKLLAEVLQRRYDVEWPGAPPVMQTQADLYLELAVFVTSVGRGVEVHATPGQIDALRDELAASLHKEPRAVREQLASVHRIWLAAKAAWDRGGESRRFPLRWQAVELLALLLPSDGEHPDVRHTVKVGSTIKDYAREAALVAGLQKKPFDALANVARNPKLVLKAVEAGLKIDPSSKGFTFLLR